MRSVRSNTFFGLELYSIYTDPGSNLTTATTGSVDDLDEL